MFREPVEMIEFFRIGTVSLDNNIHSDIVEVIYILRQTRTNSGKDEIIVTVLNLVKSRLQYNPTTIYAIGFK